MALAAIDELGGELEREWAAVDFELAAFPELCASRLQAARLPARIDADEVVRAVFAGGLPQQIDPDARFGQPPVTLYRSTRFFIDALFWVDGTTTIHDHAFSGAFQVLAGQSIETTFSFSPEPEREAGGRVRLGDLAVRGSALRTVGDVRAVPAGPAYIHSLFHLARPSLTLVVRTYKDPSPGIQLAYSPVGVAFDSGGEDPVRDRLVQMVEMLRRTEHPELESRVGDLIAACDLHTAFAIIRSCAKLPDRDLLDRLTARLADADAGRRIGRWLAERRRIDFLISRRGMVQKAPLRFLLAALLNARRRNDVLSLVAGFAPGADPARQVAAWLGELAKTTMRLQVGNAPFEPSVLGLPPFAPGCEEALADHLAGRDLPAGPEMPAFIERLRVLPALEPLFADDGQRQNR
jgi:hypothetical protein